MKNSHAFGGNGPVFSAHSSSPGTPRRCCRRPPDPPRTLLMLQSIMTGVPQFLLMAYVVIVPGGTPASQRGAWCAFEPRDAMRTGFLVVGCFAVVTPFVALVLALPSELIASPQPRIPLGTSSAAQLPLALLFGLTAGYREEFFFRSYLLRPHGRGGRPGSRSAVAVSTALFCMGHLYEGVLARRGNGGAWRAAFRGVAAPPQPARRGNCPRAVQHAGAVPRPHPARARCPTAAVMHIFCPHVKGPESSLSDPSFVLAALAVLLLSSCRPDAALPRLSGPGLSAGARGPAQEGRAWTFPPHDGHARIDFSLEGLDGKGRACPRSRERWCS